MRTERGVVSLFVAWLVSMSACSAASTRSMSRTDPEPKALAAAEGKSDSGTQLRAQAASAATFDDPKPNEGASNTLLDTTEKAPSASVNPDEQTPGREGAVSDERPYPPGNRPRPPGSVPASRDDEIIATWNHGGLRRSAVSGGEPKPPHPAPRVTVDVLQVGGNLNASDVLRVARLKGYWPFRICYEKGLLRAQKLHGSLQLLLTVGPSGTPADVQKLSVQLADPAVVSCVTKAAMGLALPAPESGTPQVTLAITLWPGDDPVSAHRPSTRGKPRFDPSPLVNALRTRFATVRACYAEGLRRHPDLWGRLAIRLRISAAGKIDDASEIESHFPDSEVTECVLKAFAGGEVPASGEEVVVVYPLRLGQLPSSAPGSKTGADGEARR